MNAMNRAYLTYGNHGCLFWISFFLFIFSFMIFSFLSFFSPSSIHLVITLTQNASISVEHPFGLFIIINWNVLYFLMNILFSFFFFPPEWSWEILNDCGCHFKMRTNCNIVANDEATKTHYELTHCGLHFIHMQMISAFYTCCIDFA